MPADHLRVERDGRVATLVIDRPSRRNALHGPLWTALHEAARSLADDPPRVVILHGTGGHFSSGMDLTPDNPLVVRLAPAVQAGDRDALRAIIGELKASLAAIASLPCPVLAAIEGACLGGGLELALTADLRVAGESARFSLPETRWGLVPDVGGTVRLSRLVGRARASDLVLTGREATASEALSWGLVNRVVPDGTTLEAARAVAEKIVATAPTATAGVLDVLRAVDGLDDEAAFAAETAAGVAALASGEPLEGLAAFAGRRKPRWER
jgi:enoyl-CoA hydratase/carnithine racemase